MMPFPPCCYCVHVHNGARHNAAGKLTCAAFPDGVPEEIVSGENPHTSAVAGDNGVRFKDDGSRGPAED